MHLCDASSSALALALASALASYSFFFSAVYLGAARQHMQNSTGSVCINTCEHTHLPWYLLVFAYNNFTFNNFWLFDEPAATAAATTTAAAATS